MTPKSAIVPWPLQCTATAIARQFRKINRKINQNVPEPHLVAIFCKKKSEIVVKQRVNWTKTALFRLAIPETRI